MSAILPIIRSAQGIKYQPLPNSEAARVWTKETSCATCKKVAAAASVFISMPLAACVLPTVLCVPVVCGYIYVVKEAQKLYEQDALNNLKKHGEGNDWDGFTVVNSTPARQQTDGSGSA